METKMSVIINKGSNNSNVVINGVSYSGNNIVVTDNSVIVDGVVENLKNNQVVNIQIDGPVETLKVENGNIHVNGNVDTIDATSADVSVTGDSKSIKTLSGDVRCQNVYGNVESLSGDISCNHVHGLSMTKTGDINIKK